MQLGHTLDYPQAIGYQLATEADRLNTAAWQQVFTAVDAIDYAIANPYDTFTAIAFTVTAMVQRTTATAATTAWDWLEAAAKMAIIAYFMFIEWRQEGAIAQLLAEVEALQVSQEFHFDALDVAVESVDFEPEELEELAAAIAAPKYSGEYLASLTTNQLRKLAESHGIPSRKNGRYLPTLGLSLALQEVGGIV